MLDITFLTSPLKNFPNLYDYFRPPSSSRISLLNLNCINKYFRFCYKKCIHFVKKVSWVSHLRVRHEGIYPLPPNLLKKEIKSSESGNYNCWRKRYFPAPYTLLQRRDFS